METLDIRKVRMKQEAMQLIFADTQWLTAEQIGAGLTTRSIPGFQGPRSAGAAKVNRWRNERRIFAIQLGDKDWYPQYQFDQCYKPLPIMEVVVNAFGDAPRIEIAAWMESPNNYLNAKRPREVVRTSPDKILEAMAYHFDRPVATLSHASFLA